MQSIDDPVAALKGVGPKRSMALRDLGIMTVFDLLTYYPFRYDDFKIQNLHQLHDQQSVTLKGTIANSPTVNYFGKRRNRLLFRLQVGKDIIPVSFFNQAWLKKQLQPGAEVLVYGKINTARMTMTGMKIIQPQQQTGLQGIYPVNRQITQKQLRDLIQTTYSEYRNVIVDFVPTKIREKYRLEPLATVIKYLHFPKNEIEIQTARRTAKFDEFFLFQMRLQTAKHHRKQTPKAQIMTDKLTLQPFLNQLPYQLTAAQQRVVSEIVADLHRPFPMNRLLQGDVGSGKTIVAAIAILATVLAHKQAVLLAPTEILAEQHANGLAQLFANQPVRIALLTGDTAKTARNQLLPRIKSGEINVIVGTHALFQPTVKYHELGLAVIDEQHRFGVNQRREMREKGPATNVLSMTATPIPRTLSITAYGEMDISVIDELPGGRKPIKTTWIRSNQLDSMLRFVKKKLQQNQQIYVVVPLIAESEAVDMRNVQDTYETFQRAFADEYRVGLLHGQLKDAEKNQVMADFKNNQLQILVSTTVIEVGVDVSNASVMVIFDADHFGLAQLHQLRGRVGRGSQQSYCILIADPKNKVGTERMNVISASNDGFFIAQKDLELRGPGDLLGKQQSGLPTFQVGDPIADVKILSVAQTVAAQITDDQQWTHQPENQHLAARLSTLNNNTAFD